MNSNPTSLGFMSTESAQWTFMFSRFQLVCSQMLFRNSYTHPIRYRLASEQDDCEGNRPQLVKLFEDTENAYGHMHRLSSLFMRNCDWSTAWSRNFTVTTGIIIILYHFLGHMNHLDDCWRFLSFKRKILCLSYSGVHFRLSSKQKRL